MSGQNHLLPFNAHVSLANTELDVDVSALRIKHKQPPQASTHTDARFRTSRRVVNKRKCAGTNAIASERNEYKWAERVRVAPIAY